MSARQPERRVWLMMYQTSPAHAKLISVCSSPQAAERIFRSIKKTGTCPPEQAEFSIPCMTLHSVRLDMIEPNALHTSDLVRMDDRAYAREQKGIWHQARKELLRKQQQQQREASSKREAQEPADGEPAAKRSA